MNSTLLLDIVWRRMVIPCRRFGTTRLQGSRRPKRNARRRLQLPIIVQQNATMYSLLYFCKLLYIFWGGNSTHHQEHI